jgi:Transposase IS116/IS110/IS902 family
VKALIEANKDRKQQYARLRKIAGLGGVVVRSSVLNTLERVPLHSADAFIAFTGLDPRPDDSGHHVGRRRLSKRGPSELRRLLYIAAMSAVKTKLWRPVYEHYRGKGTIDHCGLGCHRPAHRPHGLVDLYAQDRFRPEARRLGLDMNHRIFAGEAVEV